LTRHEVTGEVGDTKVQIIIDGPESEAEKLHSDLRSRAEELRQIIEEGEHPDATRPPVRVDWEEYHHEEDHADA